MIFKNNPEGFVPKELLREKPSKLQKVE